MAKLFEDDTNEKVQGALRTATLVLGGLTLLCWTARAVLDNDLENNNIVKQVFKVFGSAVGGVATEENKGDTKTE